MLSKVFKIDVTKCEHCRGEMTIMAAITNRRDVAELARYFKHLSIEHEAQARAPPRYNEGPFEFGSIELPYESITSIND